MTVTPKLQGAYDFPRNLDRIRRNLPTDDQIEGLLQDMGELCNSAGMSLSVTEENASDWYAIFVKMNALYDEVYALHVSDGHGTSVPIGV